MVASLMHEKLEPEPPQQPLRVLVVEDLADAAMSLDMLLTLSGYKVNVQRTGVDGLEAALTFRPDIALLDIGLPGLDGWQVAARLREQLGVETPVLIALTGYGTEEDRRKSLAAGFAHHVVKPAAPQELLALLDKIATQLRGRQPERSPKASQKAEAVTTLVSPAATKSALRILVVEDNPDAAQVLETLLQLHGYDVQSRPTGQDGIAAALSYRPHIIILDLGLPDIDGWQVARRLQTQLGDQRPILIALTAYAEEEHRRRSTEAGFDYHLSKTISPDSLLALLRATAKRGLPR
jgi:DNA-binding response OmpR family regulator